MSTILEIIKSFDVMDWLATGGIGLILTSVVTILVMLIKQGITHESDITTRKVLSESTMTQLVGVGTDVKTLLTSTSSLADNIVALSKSIESSMDMLNTVIAANQRSNVNLATFVLECFNVSNLSDEKKAGLKTLFDKTFFTDNEQLIETLTTAKNNSDKALIAANALIEQLQAALAKRDEELAQKTTELKVATSPVQKSRRM
jgi:hypothetical protein